MVRVLRVDMLEICAPKRPYLQQRGDARDEVAPMRRLPPLHEPPSPLRAVLRLGRAHRLFAQRRPSGDVVARRIEDGAYVQPYHGVVSGEACRHLGHRGQPPHLPLRRAPAAHRVAHQEGGLEVEVPVRVRLDLNGGRDGASKSWG
jgi:hypothetical protein